LARVAAPLGAEPPRAAGGDRIPLAVVAATAATIAVGLVAKAAGVNWGAAGQPLFVVFDPVLSGWEVLALAALAASLLAALRLRRAEVGPAGLGLSLFALTLFTRLALNLARSGPHGWYEVFEVRATGEGRHEYLPALSELGDGVGSFLDRFDALVPTLPVHPAGHPPGLVLTLHALGIDSAQGAAALVILAGALATPVLYALARNLFDEATARTAALLFVFVPTSLLYGATSADALFATFAVLAAAALLSRRRALVGAGAAILAVASFYSYALLAAGAWAVLVRWRREGIGDALRVAVLCAAAVLAFYLALNAATGFDVIAAIKATNLRYQEGIANVRPYVFYLFGSPAAFVFMLGPVAWFAARSLAVGEATAVALAAVIVVAVVGGYTKAETERIWLFLVPFACLAAARGLRGTSLAPVLVALAAQAFAIQILIDTRW
jgi:methylthioxylose transferase